MAEVERDHDQEAEVISYWLCDESFTILYSIASPSQYKTCSCSLYTLGKSL